MIYGLFKQKIGLRYVVFSLFYCLVNRLQHMNITMAQ